MKKIILFSFLAIGLLAGCKKSNSKLIVGSWKVTKVMKGTADVTSTWSATAYTETYASDGNYSYTGQPKSGSTPEVGSGKYTWDGSTMFKRNGVSSQSSVTCTIKTLSKSALQFTYTDSGENWDYTFEKK